MESYEVIIIGAGPAGLNCAQKLAEAGKKVLLLEKNKIIGPKICAGGFTSSDLEYLNLSDELLDCRLNKVTFSTPLQRTTLEFEKNVIFTIDRKKLGQWQLKKLKETGATVWTEARVIKIEKDYIVINNSEKVKFNYLVGADGSYSVTRKFLKIPTKKLGIAIQYLIPNDKHYEFEYIFNSNLFGAGYAWIFPHKNYVSVGTGGDPRYLSAEKLRDNFTQWLKNKKIDVAGLEIQGSSINYDYRGYKFGNIFLVGDAAGLASGLTGEGINQALNSGEEVAKMLIDENYVSNKMKKIIKANKRHCQILDFFYRSGEFRKVEFEILAFLFKNDWAFKKITGLL